VTSSRLPSHVLKRRKRALRRAVLERRDALRPEARAEMSLAIAERLLGLPDLADARTVMAFSSFGSEVDTGPVLRGLHDRGVAVALPRIEEGEVVPVAHRPGDRLARAAFGVGEPLGPALDAEALDAVVTPGVAFDRRGLRVGYGGGYYDRVFRRIRADAFRVAVAFAIQVVDEVPAGHQDLPVDALVTEAETLRFARS
jgi:5-formyltetrahydrofolate cyclo-ligase